MSNVLLLGAGFSKNWGAPLAAEVFNSLIADREVRANAAIRDLLFQHQRTDGFEGALGALQNEFARSPDRARDHLLLLQGAVSRVFGRINTALGRKQLDGAQDRFVQDRERQVGRFLTKFDYIFTLNQDLLLEMHYFGQGMELMGDPGRWAGGGSPGLVAEGTISDHLFPIAGRLWMPGDPLNVSVEARIQPYFKLHGSTNWRITDRRELMIMGGGKARNIREIPILQRYQEIFSELLQQAGMRLTIVGYGFRDDHINQVLKAAVQQHGQCMFVMDPRGSDLAYMENQTRNSIYSPSDFEAWYKDGLYSAATTSLPALLAGDSLEKEALADFIAGR